jgi:hypothetical protein
MPYQVIDAPTLAGQATAFGGPPFRKTYEAVAFRLNMLEKEGWRVVAVNESQHLKVMVFTLHQESSD